MTWMDRLEKIISEKAHPPECQKCQKSLNLPFGTFGTPDPRAFQKNNSPQHAYRFALHNGEGGGVVLTDEPDLDSARNGLLDRYGDRLALVVKA
jgi:hypothetical protein